MMIESGESEQIWQKAIREQGRGQVTYDAADCDIVSRCLCFVRARCSTLCKRSRNATLL